MISTITNVRVFFCNMSLVMLICLTGIKGFGQVESIEEQLQKVKQEENDTAVIYQYVNIALAFNEPQPDSALKYAIIALEHAKRLGDPSSLGFAYHNLGIVHRFRGEIIPSIEDNKRAIQFFGSINDTANMGTSLCNLSSVYYDRAMYKEALEAGLKGVKFLKITDDRRGLASGYSNLGMVFHQQENYNEAIEQFAKAMEICEADSDNFGIAQVAINLGNVYHDMGRYKDALQAYDRSFDLFTKATYVNGQIIALIDKGGTLKEMGRTLEALVFFKRALKMLEPYGDQPSAAFVYNNLSEIALANGESNKAIDYAQKALEIGRKTGYRESEKAGLKELADAYHKKGDYKEAYSYLEQYEVIKDSMINEENTRSMNELSAGYENEKKEMMIENYKKEQLLSDATLKQRNIISVALGLGFLLMMGGAFIAFRAYRQKRKANDIISAQKQRVEHQKLLIEEKNNEVMDSITYARRLQDAVLPAAKQVKEAFPDSFVLYIPKDVVSGDFYWMEETPEFYFLAVADCTGHGVPGAMVSMVGHNGLNRCIHEFALIDPGEILDKLNTLVEQTFDKGDENIKDGMDIALIRLDRSGEQLAFSGANNPLYIVRNGELLEIKGNKQPIGKHTDRTPFETHTQRLAPSDRLYVFSDGYADQFGGPRGKKFKYRPFKELLIKMEGDSMSQQANTLREHFVDWRGQLEQVDDVCVIGLRV